MEPDIYTTQTPGWRVREAGRMGWRPPTEEGVRLKRAYGEAFDARARLASTKGRYDSETIAAQRRQDEAERAWNAYVDTHYMPNTLPLNEVLFEHDGQPYTVLDIMEHAHRATLGIATTIAPSMRRRIPNPVGHPDGAVAKLDVDVDSVRQASEKLEEVILGTTLAANLLDRGLTVLRARANAAGVR